MNINYVDAILMYLMFLPILTVHEWAHAWTAHKFGDDTAKSLGRVSFNPLVHIDLIGTVLIPIVSVLFGFRLIGWGKPVPVDSRNLRGGRFHDNLVALAGPFSNMVMALGLLLLTQLFVALDAREYARLCFRAAYLSVFLGFFNLLPVPPLDGSHLVKNALRISEEAYAQFAVWGFVVLLVLIQFRIVRDALLIATEFTMTTLVWVVTLGRAPI
jgi:Zn-dependent protease